jgi:hypothetical protein
MAHAPLRGSPLAMALATWCGCPSVLVMRSSLLPKTMVAAWSGFPLLLAMAPATLRNSPLAMARATWSSFPSLLARAHAMFWDWMDLDSKSGFVISLESSEDVELQLEIHDRRPWPSLQVPPRCCVQSNGKRSLCTPRQAAAANS